MTYRRKIEELRLKSLRIVEKGLSDENEFTRSYHAVQFLKMFGAEELDEEIPDVLDAEQIEMKDEQDN